MAGQLSGYNYIAPILAPGSYAATTQYSDYTEMSKYDRVCVIVTAGSMPSSSCVPIQLYQGKTSTGSGAAAVGVYSTINGTPSDACTITRAAEVTLLTTCFTTGFTYAINGITYTVYSTNIGANSTATFSASRYVYATTGASTEPEKSLNHLAAYINHGTYGVPGVVATLNAASSTLTIALDADDDPDKAITIVLANSSQVMWPSKMVAVLECNSAMLATTSDFNYVSLRFEPPAIQKLSAVAVKSGSRYSPRTTEMYTYSTNTN